MTCNAGQNVGDPDPGLAGSPSPGSSPETNARGDSAMAAHRPDPKGEAGTPVEADGREPVAPDLSRGEGEGSSPSPSIDEILLKACLFVDRMKRHLPWYKRLLLIPHSIKLRRLQSKLERRRIEHG